MAQKIKPVKRSIASHKRIDHLRQLEAFVGGLVDGRLDDEIQAMADKADPEILAKFPPIDDLIKEMNDLVTGDLDKDASALNNYVDEHQNHPQSILLIRALARTLSKDLDDAGKERLKQALINELS